MRDGLGYKVGMEKGGKTMGSMGRVYISNAFSLSMIKESPTLVRIEEITTEKVKEILSLPFTSAIGHTSTAEILSEILEKKIEANRIQIQLDKNDVLIVFQLLKRLPEGSVLDKNEIEKLILERSFKFYLLKIIDDNRENYSFEL